MSHIYFQFLLLLLLSFEVSSHQRGNRSNIISVFIMNLYVLWVCGLATLGSALVYFFSYGLSVCSWFGNEGFGFSLNLTYVLSTHRVQIIFTTEHNCTVVYSWTIPGTSMASVLSTFSGPLLCKRVVGKPCDSKQRRSDSMAELRQWGNVDKLCWEI